MLPTPVSSAPPVVGQTRQVSLIAADAPAPEAPLSLTASDGTGLELVTLRSRAVIEGPLAFTELHLRFKNPRDRVLEGRFSITLPATAAIGRLAMKTDSGWQEAEIVERRRARRIYEDFLHRRQDPALMEKEAGNQFRARIFPIPANGIKDLIISYSEELPSSTDAYRLYLRGLPKVSELSAEALVLTVREGSLEYDTLRFSQRDYKPTGDFVAPAVVTLRSLRHGNLTVSRVSPSFPNESDPLKSAVILFDSSASHALSYGADVKRLGQLLAALRPDMRVKVVAFDQVVEEIFEGRAGDFSDAHRQKLFARRALGASNLEKALAGLAGEKGYERLVIIGDGVATAGAVEGDALRRQVGKLAGSFQRLDAIVVGGVNDREGLGRLVAGNLPKDGVVITADDPKIWAERLEKATRSGIEVSVEGAEWVWPTRLDGVQAGDELLIYAEVPGQRINISLTGIDTAKAGARAVQVPAPLITRSAARARIARYQDELSRLQGGDKKKRKSIHSAIVELSKEHRVLSDFTALLVLETEQDYARYGIEQSALADILTVGAAGLEVVSRKKLVLAMPFERPEAKEKAKDKSGAASGKNDDLLSEADSEPEGGEDMKKSEVAAPPPSPPSRRSTPRAAVSADEPADADEEESVVGGGHRADDFRAKMAQGPAPLTGVFAEIRADIDAKRFKAALAKAWAWRAESPADVLVLVALGEALEASGNRALAARVYGSLIDLFPSRADLRRFAAGRLQRLREGQLLAIDALIKSVAQRPDHLSGHHLLAMAFARTGNLPAAFAAAEVGLKGKYPSGRFEGGIRILREDLGLVAAAWIKKDPSKRKVVRARLNKEGAKLARRPSTRFLLTWETDANDVDFHIFDARGGHAYYSSRSLSSGGSLYADVTNGYGPECFTIPGVPRAGPYQLKIHYYSRGPMGYGMGNLDVVRHDGKGNLLFESRPYVVMNDGAYVDLGRVSAL